MKKLTNTERAALRKEMRRLKKAGLEFNHLATSPETYLIYKTVLFN